MSDGTCALMASALFKSPDVIWVLVCVMPMGVPVNAEPSGFGAAALAAILGEWCVRAPAAWVGGLEAGRIVVEERDCEAEAKERLE